MQPRIQVYQMLLKFRGRDLGTVLETTRLAAKIDVSRMTKIGKELVTNNIGRGIWTYDN